MAKKWKKLAAVSAAVVMSVSSFSALAACDNGEIPEADLKQGTYRTYTTSMPAGWCELSYEDEVSANMISFLTSSFIEWDYVFDEEKGGKYNSDGTINADAIVDGAVDTVYSAATKLEDVTSTVDAKWGYTADQKEAGGYAYKFTLREDLKWDDGTPIDATDFVYTMKEQLNPDFMNYRYSSYTDQIPILNAENYVFQGTYSYLNMISANYGDDEYVDIDDMTVTSDDTLQVDGKDVLININKGGNWGSYGLATYYAAYGAAVFGDAWETVEAKADEDGYVKLTKDDVYIICDMIAVLHGYADAEAYAEAAGDYAYLEWEEFCYYGLEFAADYSFDNVGIYSPSQYELVICLSAPVADNPLNSDGSLNLWAAYYLSSLPLVKKDLYEDCKQAPSTGSTLWTSIYNTSVSTTASWGPYKLTQYQSGKSYTLEQNENWYGWELDQYANQYNITKYTCEKVEQVSTQWTGFLGGVYDSIGIDVDHADDYRNSKYTLFTVDAAQYGASLYCNLDVLKESGRNNGILSLTEFRKAFSLAIDRSDYNSTVYTAHRPLLGLLNEAYYYDVENGGVYRYTDQAKEALLRAYGYTENADGTWSNGGLVQNADLEDAYDSLTGYDLDYAKELLEEAYATVTADPEYYGYDSSKNIQIVFGTYVDNTNTRRQYEYFKKVFATLTEGTSLEGKIEVIFDSSFSSSGQFDSFKAGEFELGAGLGWGNAPYNPFYMIGCYIDPETSYSGFWDTYSEMVTLTVPGTEGEFDGAGQTLTKSLMWWYNSLCGYTDSNTPGTYNWSSIDTEYRLELLAAIEEYVLEQYYFIPTTSYNSASMLGAKFSYITNNYNTFMSYGGLRYMIVNYTDTEWDAYVAANNNDLTTEYKKTN